MAIIEHGVKNQATMVLNNGLDASGNITTVNVSLGTLADSGWDAAKAYTIMEAIEACLTKTIYQKRHVYTTELVEDE